MAGAAAVEGTAEAAEAAVEVEAAEAVAEAAREEVAATERTTVDTAEVRASRIGCVQCAE